MCSSPILRITREGGRCDRRSRATQGNIWSLCIKWLRRRRWRLSCSYRTLRRCVRGSSQFRLKRRNRGRGSITLLRCCCRHWIRSSYQRRFLCKYCLYNGNEFENGRPLQDFTFLAWMYSAIEFDKRDLEANSRLVSNSPSMGGIFALLR